MSRYRYGKQGNASQSEKSRFRTFVKVLFITILLLVPFAAYIIITSLPPSPVTGKTVDKGYYDPYSTIKSDWFSFRVEQTWEEISEITVKDKVYFYREMQGKNQQGLLVIYVNSRPEGFESFYTNVVPVVIKDENSLESDEMQPHCDSATTPTVQNNYEATQANTTFTCWAGGPVMYAVAGEINGGVKLKMKRENGDYAEYTIAYRNLAFTPNTTTFSKVLSTFKSR